MYKLPLLYFSNNPYTFKEPNLLTKILEHRHTNVETQYCQVFNTAMAEHDKRNCINIKATKHVMLILLN